MRKILFIVILFACTSRLHAQSLTPTVLGAAGGSFSNSTVSLDWTVGELAITTLSSTNNLLTQGFHQGEKLLSGINSEIVNGTFSYTAFPNPVSGMLNLQFAENATGAYQVSLCDMTGKVLGLYENIKPQMLQSLQIPMEKYSEGMYFLKVQSQDGTTTSTVKILKTTY